MSIANGQPALARVAAAFTDDERIALPASV